MPTASNEKKGLMPIGQALTNEFVLKSGEVLLLSLLKIVLYIMLSFGIHGEEWHHIRY